MPEAQRRVTTRQPSAPAKVVPIDTGGHRERLLAERDQLVASNVAMVASIARSLVHSFPAPFTFDDLIGVGNLALLNAAMRYRPAEHNNAPFSAYARMRVRGAMIDLLADKPSGRREESHAHLEADEEPAAANAIEISIDKGRLWRRVKEAIAQLPPRQREVLTAYYGPAEPSLAIVAGAMKISPAGAKKIHAQAIDGLRDLLRVAQ